MNKHQKAKARRIKKLQAAGVSRKTARDLIKTYEDHEIEGAIEGIKAVHKGIRAIWASIITVLRGNGNERRV